MNPHKALCIAALLSLAGQATAKVVINEIHYHPANSAVLPGENPEDLQFIELYNTGPGTVDLSGWSFSQGISFTFPAGTTLAADAYLVVAANPTLLGLRVPTIPTGVKVFKWTGGDLSNAGETITLVDSNMSVMDQVTYDDAGLWPAQADGAGASLELVNPEYDKSYPLVWRASSNINGTPGAINSTFSENPIIAATLPDRGSVVPVLTQVQVTFAKPVTGVVASDLIVDGSAATSVSCPACSGGAGVGPYVFTGFASPKSNPFTITLSAGNIKDLSGRSFDGDSWLYFQSVPAVVINEIHYNPLSSTDNEEFIELYNADSSQVDISGWRLTEFASPGCTFPSGTVMQPGAYIVCAKDPSALKAATGYETIYSWGTNDSLSNGGEPISLLNASGTVIDRVVYGDSPPWPNGPDGNGPSLELINPKLDNSQAQFWRASTVTNGTPGARNSVYSETTVVASESPARGSVIIALPEVTVTFSTPVIGVTAASLEVNGTPALSVSGSGAGPYVFTVNDPGIGVVTVDLSGDGIVDQNGIPFTGDSWLYFYGLPRIVINEIHYHPAKSAVGASENPEDLEFIELYNSESSAVDLSGWAMSAGLSLIIPDGTQIAAQGYVVLAKNAAFLKSKVTIPALSPVVQWESGNLSNNGERLRLTDRYGNIIDELVYADEGDWTDSPDGKGPSLELINPLLPNESPGAWKASTTTNGTPGAQNSVFMANPPPIIYGTLHNPPIPAGGQSVTITTNVIDDAGEPSFVKLYYRLDQDPPIAYSSMPMFDDGNHGDGAAGDGKYGAIVPGLADGQQLDFYIEASDGFATSVAPAGHATLDKYGLPSQTYLCKFSNEILPTDFPVYHILVTLAKKKKQEALNTYPGRKEPFDATFIDGEGNIWYNVIERYRGQSSLFKYPSSYQVEFPSNRKLMTPLGFPVEELQLNGMRPMGQYIGYNLFNRAGMPAPLATFAHVRYTGINYDTCCRGQNSYYTMHVVVERYDNAFLDSQNGAAPNRGTSSEGNLYRGRNDANLRWEGTNPDTYRTDANGQNGYVKYNHEAEDFWGDLIALCDALSNTPPEHYVEHVKAHVNEDEWARYFALMMLLGNREGGIYRDTGDDYFLYFPPVSDPNNPPHPDYTTPQLPDDRLTGRSLLMPWDTDSVIMDANETIWRTTTPAVQKFLRHNAFAPIFVKSIEDLISKEFSLEAMSALIDSMPDSVFGVSEGSDLWPETKQQFKNWIANRIAYVLNETVDKLTLSGVPASPYEATDPVIHLYGQLQQAGTHNVTVNGQQANFSVYEGKWSYDLTLVAGMNHIVVQAWDRDGKEKDRVEQSVFYNPPGPWQLHLDLRAPTRMVNDKTLTIVAAISDPIGRVAWNNWEELGTISVVRLPDRTKVKIKNTVFDNHVPVVDGTIRFINGWGTASFTLDAGESFAQGDIEVTVGWNGLIASRRVTVLKNPTFRDMIGTLTGANLVWGPNENIRITGNCTVPAGSTLTIHPGTIVQVNTTGTLENGTLITVNGSLQALGTKDQPIFFFSERGPAAMKLTQSGSASNGDAWRGFQFRGSGSSTLRHVILTGAGNGNVVSHPRPPILGMFDTHSLLSDRSVFADNNGMVFSGQGTGNYTVRKTLVSRCGIGAEFFGNGHTLLVRDSWWTSCGRAPESAGLDGDLLHVDGAASVQTIRSSIINDGGDDGIDHSNSNFRVEHSIITNVRDKAISMTGGHVDVWNVLIFNTATGIRGTAKTDYLTITVPSPIQTVDAVNTSIIWPVSIPTCTGSVNYTDVGNPAHLGCGTGNISTDPMFTDVSHYDYNPRPGSPALTAGPNQDRIGWLGFPYGSVCKTSADCDDTNACTTDVCVDKLCVFTPIVGCIPCDIDEDCDDSNPCTTDVCAPDGSCRHTLKPNGTTCDDGKPCTSPDTCKDGVCAGPESCPPGMHCEPSGYCVTNTITITFQDGVNGYAGTHDTYLNQAQPDTPQGDRTTWRFDLSDPDTTMNQEYGLIKFTNIFGSGQNQIPPGSTIFSATLTLNVEDQSDVPAGSVHEVLVTWDEANATWNNFGGEPGVQPDEYGMFVGSAPIATGTFVIDVTSSIRAWLASPSNNNGWLFIPASVDGCVVTSSEGATVTLRPMLTVVFAPPVVTCTSDTDCSDGQFCNGVETCNLATHVCESGIAPNCDDGIECTIDSCNEVQDKCDHVLSDAVCDDGNLCTDDTCDPAVGCRHVNNNAPCDDGNACTISDVCQNGVCSPGQEASCDDGVPCTSDNCEPATGCTHTDTCPVGQVCNLGTGSCEKGPITITFQQGLNGYTGTVDTYIAAGAPNADNSAVTPLVVDGNNPPDEERQTLLRFDGIFGNGANQIPQGARIVSATLTIFVTNPSPDGASLHRMIIPWKDTDSWNSLHGGVQQDGIESLATPDTSGATNSNKVHYNMDVTSSLIAWSGGQANWGWVFVAPDQGTDSWQFASSENDDPDTQPKLTVRFIPCDPGYRGDGVQCYDIDECTDGTYSCDVNAVCMNTVGSYECICKEGFTGDGHLCQDINECLASPCDPNATCTNTPGSYTCTCNKGYQGNGSQCTDIDECATDPDICGKEAYCVNTIGAYECMCKAGYELVSGRCEDINECTLVPYPCSQYATCTNLPGAYACTCKPGYTGNGKVCTDINECAAVPGPCDQNALCINISGSYACICNAGYTGDGKTCSECPGGAANPCSGHGTCSGPASVPVCTCTDNFGGADCSDCIKGHYGPTCDQLCPGGEAHPCSDHGVCSDGVLGTGTCTCFTGYAGDACDECAEGFYNYPDCSQCPDCNDNNVCTTDICDNGCQHVFNTLPCDDGDECTVNDTCMQGTCVGTPRDCDDKNVCTKDSCDPSSGCLHEATPGCCTTDADCTPKGKCLYRSCNLLKHVCGAFEAIPGCCTTDEDCDDGRAVTADSCDIVTGTCINTGGCTSVDDCYDGNPCTIDSCNLDTAECVHKVIPDCCFGDDCGGGDTSPTPDVASVPETAPDTSAFDADISAQPDAYEVSAGDPSADTSPPVVTASGGCAASNNPSLTMLLLLALMWFLRRQAAQSRRDIGCSSRRGS